MNKVIEVNNLSKKYRLGVLGIDTLRADVSRKIAQWRGKADPTEKIGESQYAAQSSKNLWALKDVSFSVEQGEVLGIIGHNGAGKSTLLKILSRITYPTSGNVRLSGRVGSLLEVGTGFHPELTGRENIYLNGAILGMTREEVTKKIEQIIDFAEISRFIDTPIKRYSSGMSVRLAFSIAAHLEPEILILDEVLAVGDASFQAKCIARLQASSKSGHTILFVSHNLSSIEQLCSRCLLMSSGQIVADGDTHQVIKQYESSVMSQMGSGLVAGQDEEQVRVSNFIVNALKPDGSTSQKIYCYDQIRISIAGSNNAARSIERIKLSIWKDTQQLLLIDSDSQSTELRLENEFSTACVIHKLPLTAGRYTINLEFHDSIGTVAKWETASIFYVRARKDTSTDIEQFGPVRVDSSWSQ